MLELRVYTKAELAAIFKTTNRQGLTRKMQRYGIRYEASGRGDRATFNILETADPFKVFCIDELGYDGRTKFDKLRNFLYYFLNDDEFRAMPDEVKAQRLKAEGKYMCRQTIAKYIAKLDKLDIVKYDTNEFIYYFAYKGTQRIATREEYSAAWKRYWADKARGEDTFGAIWNMRDMHGGVARKQAVPQINGIYAEKMHQLNIIICESIENELG